MTQMRNTVRRMVHGAWLACACSIVLCLSLISAPTARAQVLYGALTGSVTDTSGAAIPGAQITASEAQTGVTQTTTADSAGIYRFAALLPGTYKVTITAAGFSKQETLGVLIRANEVARVDASGLKVGTAAQDIVVTTEAPLLQTDKADVHTEITSQQIENLPIQGSQGRNFQSLLKVVPGAGLVAETNSLAGNPQRAINVNLNGQSNQGNNTRIDGAQDSYSWLPANVAYVPPADAIENVNVVTNSFDAEQGMAGGAAVNVIVKSGTNRFHGGANWYHTDQNFAARNYFQTDTTIAAYAKKNRNNQNQFGGYVGGPIFKDKLFFFTDFERTTQRQLAGPDTRTLPTAAMAAGDFTAWLPPVGSTATFGKEPFQDCNKTPAPGCIYDPMTGNIHGANKTEVTCNGVANVICPSRFDPATVAMVKLLQPNIANVFPTNNGLNNWVGSGTALFNRNDYDVKINYVPSQKTTLFGRYSISNTLVFDPPLLGAAIGDATNGGQLGNAPGRIQSVGLGATHSFSPRLLFDWNFGYNRQRLGSTFDLVSANGLNDLGIPGTNNAGAPGDPSLYYGYPGFIFPTGQAAPGSTIPNNQVNIGNAQTANPFLFRDNQYVTGANLSWTKQRHNIRGGIEWNHAQINHFQPQGGTFQNPRGVLAFNGYITSQQGTAPTWFNSWADFMFGLPDVTGKARALFNPNSLRWTQWSWYVRDQWQLTANLTINVGLRWEYYPFGYSDNDKGLRYLNLKTGNVLIGGYGGIPQNDGIDTGHGQFLPRVGINYRFTPSTVVQAGYGQSADANNWRYFRNAYPAVILDTNSAQNSADYIAAASLTGLNAKGLGSGSYSVPTGITLLPVPSVASGVIPLPQTAGTTTIPNPFRRGYINSYNVILQQDMGWLVLKTGYVGAMAVRPLVNMNANASLPGTGSAGGLLSQAYTQAGLCSPCNYTATINQLIPFKNNYYNSLQTTVTHRWANGSMAGLVHTWAKGTNYEDNEDLSSLAFPYPTYWSKNRGLASYNRAQNVEIYGVLRSPFGKGERWVTTGAGGAILGGWVLNPLVSMLSGVPFTVTATSSLNANGSTETADLVRTYHKINAKPLRTGQTCGQTDLSCHYFDASAFAAPLITSAATAHFGNTGRNQFIGPGYFSFNLGLIRDFKLWEFGTFEIRADAINLTNTPHFANPNVSCPGSGTAPDPLTGSGGNCTTGTNNNFGVITSTAQPGGFFGPDPGSRVIWMGASVKF